MSDIAATVAVEVLPETKRFGRELARKVAPQASKAGTQAGQAMGRSVTRSFGGAIRGITSQIRSSFASVGSTTARAFAPAIAAVRQIGTTAAQAFQSIRAHTATAAKAVTTRLGAAFTRVRTLGVRAAQAIGRRFQTSAKQSSTAFLSLRTILGGLGVGAAIASVTSLVGSIKEAGLAANEARAALSGRYDNLELANQTVKDLQESFKGSSIAIQSFYGAADSLGYMGIEGQKAVGLLETMEKTSLSGAQGIDSIVSAMGTAQNMGKVTFNEINQISKAGFPVFSELQEHFGMTEEELTKFVTDGKLGLEDLIHVMENPQTEFFDSAVRRAEEMNQTFGSVANGIKQNLIITLGEFAAQIGERLTPHLINLAGWLEDLPAKIAAIREKAEELGIVDAIKNFFSGAQEFAQSALPVAQEFFTVIGTAAVGLLLALEPLGDMLSGLAGWFKENESVAGLLGAVLGGLVIGIVAVRVATMAWAVVQAILNASLWANPIGLIVIAIAALVAGVIYAYNNFEGFKNVIDTVWEALKAAFNWVVEFFTGTLVPAFQSFWEKAKEVWEGLRDSVQAVWDWLRDNVFTPIVEFVQRIKDGFEAQTLGRALGQQLRPLGDG